MKKEVEAERERRVSEKDDTEDARARAMTYDKLVLVQEQLLSTICQMKVTTMCSVVVCHVHIITLYGIISNNCEEFR